MIRFFFLLFIFITLSGCSGCPYSFTGSSVPKHLKTISVPLFDDQSGLGEPGLREKFTNKLIDRFIKDNSLEVSDKTHADCTLEGAIISVRDEPLVISKGESVTKRRVTVTVNVIFQDMKLKKKIFEKQFTNTGDYEIGSGTAQQQIGIDAAIDKLTEDILIETVSGW
jgi:hypothetical protein